MLLRVLRRWMSVLALLLLTTELGSHPAVAYVSPGLVVSSFLPTSGAVGTKVTVYGSGFSSDTGITVGGKASAQPQISSATQLSFTVPTGANSGQICATNASTTGCSSDSFAVVASPVVTSFTPSSGPVGSLVKITGSNLTGIDTVTFNGTFTYSVSNVTATSLTVVVPTAATSGKVCVLDAYEKPICASGSFTVAPGSVPIVNTATIKSGDGSPGSIVQLTGSGFTEDMAVMFGAGIAADDRSFKSPTTFEVTVPSKAMTSPICAANQYGSGCTSKAFRVPGYAIIEAFYPSIVATGGTIIIMGPNTGNVTEVRIGSSVKIPLSSLKFTSPTSLEFLLPSGAPQDYLSAISEGGFTSVSGSKLNDPADKSVTCSQESGKSGERFTVTGQNFTPKTKVFLNGELAAAAYLSDSQVEVGIPFTGNATGRCCVSAIGNRCSDASFTVTPILKLMTPTSGKVGTPVTFTGFGFFGASRLTFNGKEDSTFSILSDNEVSAHVPSGATSGKVCIYPRTGKYQACSDVVFTVTSSSSSSSNSP